MPTTKTAKRLVVGRRMPTDQLGEENLPKRRALPVLASDALSSNAYATQEMLLVLSLAGFAFYSYAPQVALCVVAVFAVVVLAYRQNVHAYPAGGDYEVVSRNLGRRAGVFAGAALLIDYSLTVAVSLSAAVANISSMDPRLAGAALPVAVALVVLLALLNLRGGRPHWGLLAAPTYLFLIAIVGMLLFAGIRLAAGEQIRAESADWELRETVAPTGFALAFLLARAFSTGNAALTGVETISSSVGTFREPRPRNAATTLLLTGAISVVLFLGITWLALATGVKVAERDDLLIGLPPGQEQQTVIAQIARAVFDGFPPAALFVMLTTAMILVLAANTAFRGFPVLASTLASNDLLPRQLKNRGDRLAFSNGIIALAIASAGLVLAFHADVTRLIQLYLVGVFLAFAMSQLAMVRHWSRALRGGSADRARLQGKRLVSATGFVLTGAVLLIVLVTKFLQGAWIVAVAVPLLAWLMLGIGRHYGRVEAAMHTPPDEKVTLPSRVRAVVLVARVDAPTLRALRYAQSQRPTSIEAVHIDVAGEGARELAAEWDRRGIPVPLRLISSPYREITRPVVEYLQGLGSSSPRDLILVYLPAYRPERWWQNLLHQQTALRLSNRLAAVPGVMVANVPQRGDGSGPGSRTLRDRAGDAVLRLRSAADGVRGRARRRFRPPRKRQRRNNSASIR